MTVHRCSDYDAIYGLEPRFVVPEPEVETKVLQAPEKRKPRKGRTVSVKRGN